MPRNVVDWCVKGGNCPKRLDLVLKKLDLEPQPVLRRRAALHIGEQIASE
jgi:hypothetical protein